MNNSMIGGFSNPLSHGSSLSRERLLVDADRLYYELSDEQRSRMNLARRGEEIIYRCNKYIIF